MLPVLDEIFVCWHGRNEQVRHPRDMGAVEGQQFLFMLTTPRRLKKKVPAVFNTMTASGGTASPLDALSDLVG